MVKRKAIKGNTLDIHCASDKKANVSIHIA
jgi:3D (Asp-Asp-Asp) domain-containing protein